jgi:hypothetical protein
VKITKKDQKILADFYLRRQIFDTYIEDQQLQICTCPGCAYPTLISRGHYQICDVCNWEDDNQDDKTADEVWGGPNGKLSLTANRIAIGNVLIKIAASQKTKVFIEPAHALKIITHYKRKKIDIRKEIPIDETMDHPIWTKWNQVEKDLQMALCAGSIE